MEKPTTECRTVLLVHTGSRRLSETASFVREEMLRREPAAHFAYFVRDLTRLTPVQVASQMHELVRLCATADIVICETDCLPADIARHAPAGQRRVLVLPPKANMIDGSPVKPAAALPYTDIVVQNARFAEHFSARYPSGGGAALMSTGLPILDALSSASYRVDARERLYDLFPDARGRKIVSLTMHFDARASLGNVDLPRMADLLGGEYFLLVQAPGVFPALAGYDSRLAEFVCNSGGLFSVHEVVAVADTLISTRFGDAVCFSATEDRFVYFSRNRLKVPEGIAALTITRLDEIPTLLAAPPNTAALTAFRDEFVSPNREGCTARLVESLL